MQLSAEGILQQEAERGRFLLMLPLPFFHSHAVAVGAVDGVAGAVRHIAAHSTHHSDAVVTENGAQKTVSKTVFLSGPKGFENPRETEKR